MASSISEVSDRRRAAEMDPLYRVKAGARFLDVSERSFRRLLAEEKLTYIKRGRYVRISLSSLNAYVSEGLRPAREVR